MRNSLSVEHGEPCTAMGEVGMSERPVAPERPADRLSDETLESIAEANSGPTRKWGVITARRLLSLATEVQERRAADEETAELVRRLWAIIARHDPDNAERYGFRRRLEDEQPDLAARLIAVLDAPAVKAGAAAPAPVGAVPAPPEAAEPCCAKCGGASFSLVWLGDEWLHVACAMPPAAPVVAAAPTDPREDDVEALAEVLYLGFAPDLFWEDGDPHTKERCRVQARVALTKGYRLVPEGRVVVPRDELAALWNVRGEAAGLIGMCDLKGHFPDKVQRCQEALAALPEFAPSLRPLPVGDDPEGDATDG